MSDKKGYNFVNGGVVWIDDSNRDDLNTTSGGSVWPGYIPGTGFYAGTALYPPQDEYIFNRNFDPIKQCKYCRSKFASDFIVLSCPQCGAPLD